MKTMHWILILAALGAAGGVPGPAIAQQTAMLPPTATSMTSLGEARPVPAWLGFCQRQPQECAVDFGEPDTIRLTRGVWQLLLAVNAEVNAAITPMTDEDHWATADLWDYPNDGRGDCEDYQLLKRKRLVEKGLPHRALRMTVVIDEKGDGHAVLMVRTDRGDFILDNKRKAVLPWHQTGYVFVKRESADGPGWTSLGGVTSPVTTANR